MIAGIELRQFHQLTLNLGEVYDNIQNSKPNFGNAKTI